MTPEPTRWEDRSVDAQIREAIAILEAGTDYEKLHVPAILRAALTQEPQPIADADLDRVEGVRTVRRGAPVVQEEKPTPPEVKVPVYDLDDWLLKAAKYYVNHNCVTPCGCLGCADIRKRLSALPAREPTPVAQEERPAHAVEFGPAVGSGWRPSAPRWQRHIECPNRCGYMAFEYWQRGAVTGVCTKCGHCWRSSRETPASTPVEDTRTVAEIRKAVEEEMEAARLRAWYGTGGKPYRDGAYHALDTLSARLGLEEKT